MGRFPTKYGTLAIGFDHDFDLEALVEDRLQEMRQFHESGILQETNPKRNRRQLERAEDEVRSAFARAPDPAQRLYNEAESWGKEDHIGERATQRLLQIWNLLRVAVLETGLDRKPPSTHPYAIQAFYLLWLMCEESEEYNRVLVPGDEEYEKYDLQRDEYDTDEVLYLLNHVPNSLHPWDAQWGDVIFKMERDGETYEGKARCDYAIHCEHGRICDGTTCIDCRPRTTA